MQRSFVLLIGLVACGGSPAPPEHPVPRPRAMMAWDTGGDCVPRSQETDPCVHLTPGDVSAIRDAILARLHDTKDIPDAGLMQRLAERPIAQWTASTYQFQATSTGLALAASEAEAQGMIAGFKCLLANTDGGWSVVELSPFAAM